MSRHVLVVGAGFAGSVCARELAEAGCDVHIIDKRPHIGGNAFDKVDDHGVLIHPYGPHIFHTKSKRVFEYLSRFTDWRFYEHRVRAVVDQKLYPIPINRTTINLLYGLNLTEKETGEYLDKIREPRAPIRTSEDAVLNSVGHDLCDKFFRGYTRKQWGLDLSELSASVAARIPTRTNDDDRYFDDEFQFIPSNGYTNLFKNLLDHPNIRVSLDVDYFSLRGTYECQYTVYSGPIDAFFEHRLGKLPYRSLDFVHEHLPSIERLQDVGTINYPNDHSFTRVTEFKHLTGQCHSGTSIVREYPQSEGEPYYPIPRAENEALYKQYETLADNTENVAFIGRLAQYRYYNMDQVVGAALALAKKLEAL